MAPPSLALRAGLFLLFGGAWALLPGGARADVTHTVARGHTIEAIAHRYHVTVKAIVDQNHIKDPKHLKVGETLVIPGVTKPEPTGHGTVAAALPGGKGDKAGGKERPQKPINYASRPKTPDVIHATRLATSEDFQIRVKDRRGRVPPTAIKSFQHMLRATNNQEHEIEPRLVALAGIVSNHFGGRKIEVISGFRPYKTTQYTKHSNHNIGHAMDFRVVGVPNEVLRDYCRTLKNTGCGYYPNSTFVHMDARASSAYWIDYSHPGEAPRYGGPGGSEADEGTSDVGDEVHTPIEGVVDGGAASEGASPSDAGAPVAPQAATPTLAPTAAPTPAPAPTPTTAPTPTPSAAPAPSTRPAVP